MTLIVIIILSLTFDKQGSRIDSVIDMDSHYRKGKGVLSSCFLVHIGPQAVKLSLLS